jgi:hypothetical protein
MSSTSKEPEEFCDVVLLWLYLYNPQFQTCTVGAVREIVEPDLNNNTICA